MSTATQSPKPAQRTEEEIRANERWRIYRLIRDRLNPSDSNARFLAIDEICDLVRSSVWEGAAQ